MLILMTGGSGSGKSAIAESIAVSLKNENGRFLYCATMYADHRDPETLRRIARHREMRAGKGFETIEIPLRIGETEVRPGDVMLIEDIPNLLANEIWMEGGRVRTEEDAVCYIADEIIRLSEHGCGIVAVTGIISADGLYETYDEEMKQYIRGLNRIGMRLAEYADRVVESVCGIPVELKGE